LGIFIGFRVMNFDIINQFKYMKSHTKIIIRDSRRMLEIGLSYAIL